MSIVYVQFKSHSLIMPLLVVPGDDPSLLGRNSLFSLGIVISINHTEIGSHMENHTRKYPVVFAGGHGLYKGPPVKIAYHTTVFPKFFKVITIPLADKEKANTEIDRLVAKGVWKPVRFLKWAFPLVPVCIPDGSIRLWGDYISTLIRQFSSISILFLPTTKYFLLWLMVNFFTKLNLDQAYTQLLVDEKLHF